MGTVDSKVLSIYLIFAVDVFIFSAGC